MAILPRQKRALRIGQGIANPLGNKAMSKYRTMKAEDPTQANTFAARKLGLNNYNAEKAKLNPFQRYRYGELKTDRPNVANNYRKGILNRQRNRQENQDAPPQEDVTTAPNDVLKTLLPEQAQPDPTQDLLYQWRMGQGQKALDQQMAKMGLTNSSRQAELSGDLAARIGAEESANMWGRAQDTNSYRQDIANRLERIVGNETNRRDNRSDTRFNQVMQIVDAYNRRNPLDIAANAGGNQSDLLAKIASFAGGGGGGGSGVQTPFYSMPPMDTTLSGIYGAGAGAGGTSDSVTNIGNFLGDLFGWGK